MLPPGTGSRVALVSFAALFAVGAAGIVRCGPLEWVDQPTVAEIERAQEELEPFKTRLFEALMGSLEQGPASSIHVCREKAPQIAAELSVGGVEMGRTSHRLRNPANAPPDWVAPLLARYVADPELVTPTAVYLDEGRVGYVEPIRAIHLCVSCHGPAVKPELLAEVRSLYPEDQATGFRVGDLRGLFWVTLPVEDG